MNILVSWLRDFVDLPPDVTPEALAEALNLRGFELAGLAPAPPGVPGAGGADAVIDLDVTTNRPDCLSVIGIAREVAAMYDRPLRLDRLPAAPEAGSDGQPDAALSVHLDDPELCPRYAAAVARVRVAPSPSWLAARLLAAGVRPINNIVDVTNYVLVELGHPMHGFDLDRLAGRELRIRRAAAGERIRTLDGEDRQLLPDMLVIADAVRPQAVAGVMGGADSEVTLATRRVALESAYFLPRSVRRTSRRLGLSTDASYRFERGADISAPVAALARAAALLAEIGAGTVEGGYIDRYPVQPGLRRVRLRHDRLERLLGTPVEEPFVVSVLTRLGFDVERTGGDDDGRAAWNVTVPLRRVDVAREADLIEEVARHYGYERLPGRFPAMTAPPATPHPALETERALRHVLIGLGFSEAVTFSFIDAEAAAAFAGDAGELVAVANPLSAKFSTMRPSLLPGLVESLAYNTRRERRDVQLFEVGRRFLPAGERRTVAMAWTGSGLPEHWSGKSRPVDFFDIKGAVNQVCRAAGADVRFEAGGPGFLADGRSALVRGGASAAIGVVGQLAPRLAAQLGMAAADEVYVAEIDLDALAAIATPPERVTVESLPRHPSVVRDLSLVVDSGLPAATVRGTIRSAAPPILARVHEFDRYQGAGVPAGRVSLSFRLTFRAPDRTLTDAEVQAAVDGIVAALAREHGAVRR